MSEDKLKVYDGSSYDYIPSMAAEFATESLKDTFGLLPKEDEASQELAYDTL